ncbi:MAG: hypothetical protein ACXADL_11100 [Candidatus Thorarchaeota archaeon]|jgi:hypothetical protein
MKIGSILELAFQNVAPHIVNLELLQSLVKETTNTTESIDDVIVILESKMEGQEVTAKTDIRILINEVRHLLKRKSTG